MKAIIEIEMDNDAFRNTPNCAAQELSRILGRLEDDVLRYAIGEVGHRSVCIDFNGNRVGKLEIVEE